MHARAHHTTSQQLTSESRQDRLLGKSRSVAAGMPAHARHLASIACSTVALLGCIATAAGAEAPATIAPPANALADVVATRIAQPRTTSAAAAAFGLGSPRGATSAFQVTDNTGASMDGLDITVNPVDPARSYLGVYHINIGAGRFALRLAASKDLMTWRKIADLDIAGGAMGTLRALPGGGFLLAYETQEPTTSDGTINTRVRLSYYRDPAALLAGTATEQRTLPRRLSTSNEGTPDFRAITWHGSLANSVVTLGFHYLDHGSNSAPRRLPVDREARGMLIANHWLAAPDTDVDRALTRLGFNGNHGARRQFTAPGGRRWRVYEAQRYVTVNSSWRLLLYNVTSRTWTVLRITTPQRSTALANPTVSVLPSPHAPTTNVLVTTMFVHAAGAGPGESGEAISYAEL
jgi:hypothetical protein